MGQTDKATEPVVDDITDTPTPDDDKVALAAPEPDTVAVDDQTAEDVAAYLERNPTFFDTHPHLLESVQLAHASGAAASLIERQVDVLRDRNEQLRLRLHQLAQTARGNEQRVRHVNRFAVALLGARSVDAVLACTRQTLTQLFTVDAVTVGLYTPSSLGALPADGAIAIGEDDPFRTMFRDFIRTGLIECGPLTAEKSARLFGESADRPPMASAAVVPLDRVEPLGVLAVGSTDPERFAPRMGTLFLDMAADLICAALRGVSDHSGEPASG